MSQSSISVGNVVRHPMKAEWGPGKVLAVTGRHIKVLFRAPKFNVVSKPNDWTKRVVEPVEPSETQRLRQEYWAALRERLLDKQSPVKPQKALPQSWASFALGRADCYLTAIMNGRDRRLACYVTLTGPVAKARFRALEAQKEEIRQEFGEPLEWRELRPRRHTSFPSQSRTHDESTESNA